MGNNLHTLLALLLISIANVTMSSFKQVLAEVKHGHPAWSGLLHPLSLLNTKGVLASLGGGDSTKVLGTDCSHWELICSEFSGAL